MLLLTEAMFWLFDKNNITEDDIISAYKEFFWKIKKIENAKYISEGTYWFSSKITLENSSECFAIIKKLRRENGKVLFEVKKDDICLRTNNINCNNWYVFFFHSANKYDVYHSKEVAKYMSDNYNSNTYWVFDYEKLQENIKAM